MDGWISFPLFVLLLHFPRRTTYYLRCLGSCPVLITPLMIHLADCLTDWQVGSLDGRPNRQDIWTDRHFRWTWDERYKKGCGLDSFQTFEFRLVHFPSSSLIPSPPCPLPVYISVRSVCQCLRSEEAKGFHIGFGYDVEACAHLGCSLHSKRSRDTPTVCQYRIKGLQSR